MKAFPILKMHKSSWMLLEKKYTKFSKNEENELSGNHWVNVCFESNVIDVSSDTWCFNSGATIHACNSIFTSYGVHGRWYKSPS